MPSPHLSIIIPAHNEEHRLPRTLEQVVRFAGSQTFETEVLVVENASRDRTFEVGQEFASRHHAMVQMLHEDLPGKGRAVRTGMLAAKGACLVQNAIGTFVGGLRTQAIILLAVALVLIILGATWHRLQKEA